MSRYIGPSCRLCRREGTKLYLKGDRCFTDKCPVEKKKTPPGQHGTKRTKLSDYGVQLREKQKLKRYYAMQEKQFRSTFNKVASRKGKTGDLLLQSLELRLDSVLRKMGVGVSQNSARQIATHNHVLINGKRCNIPSRLLKVGDKITFKNSILSIPSVVGALETAKKENHSVPAWLNWDIHNLSAEVVAIPQRDEIHIPVREQLVVELYSK